MGSLAAIGIVKGKPFNPDARMKKILTDAAAIGNAAARTLNLKWRPSDGGYYYSNSTWFNPLFLGGYNMETPPPQVSADGVITPYPPTGARTLNVRTAMFFGYTFITPAMIMRLTDIGSQYLVQARRFQGRVFRRQQDLQGHPAAEHPGGEILVLHRLRQPDALDARHAAALPARRQPELSDARRGSQRRRLDDRVFRPDASPTASTTGNWIQTDPEKGLVHDPASLQPARTVLHEGVAAERDRIGRQIVPIRSGRASIQGGIDDTSTRMQA